MKKIILFSFLVIILSCTGCESLQRSQASGYASNAKSNSYAGADLENSKALEFNLRNAKEKEQYSKVLPWITAEEKKDFLRLPSLENRQQWINEKQIWKRKDLLEAQYKDSMQSQDIHVGMPQDFVRRSWGEPNNIETSGLAVYKNEKWQYSKFVSAHDGFKKEIRTVYFEDGKVAGWETEFR
ncbi:MAG: hypothetical protein ACOYOK_09395 [Pseudobdellovibrionaceae bacterium]